MTGKVENNIGCDLTRLESFRNLEERNIYKERIWAVAACVGTALLVVAAVALTIYWFSHIPPCPPHFYDGVERAVLIRALPVMLLGMSCFGFVLACNHAIQVFKSNARDRSPPCLLNNLPPAGELELDARDADRSFVIS